MKVPGLASFLKTSSSGVMFSKFKGKQLFSGF